MSLEYRGFIDREYFSRYSKDRVINDGDHLFHEYSSSIDLSSVSYTYHTVSSSDEEKLTIIAQNYYGNPLYWWMIAMANGLSNPFDSPKRGTQLKIPYKDEVVRLFNKVVD